jgi:phospholipid-binding lipoprotein MlaA
MGTGVPENSWTQSPAQEDDGANDDDLYEENFDDLYGDQTEINDPLERLNRAFHGLNRLLDGLFLKPWAHFYDIAVADPLKTGCRNAIKNIYAPLSIINYILQGRPDSAGKTLGRFLANTTVGLGGFLNPAERMGIDTPNTGFGDTLGVWGASPGFYIELPVFGPSSLRDSLGLVVDYFTDPFRLFTLHKRKNLRHKRRLIYFTTKAIEISDKRFQLLDVLDNLEKNSLDFYTALKSSYTQNREAHIKKLRRRIPEERRSLS